MKKNRLLCFIAAMVAVLFLDVSCAEDYYYVTTDISHTDRVHRKVFLSDTAILDDFRANEWKVSEAGGQDSSFFIKGNDNRYKAAATCISGKPDSLGLFFIPGIREKIDKHFKWFTTEYVYSAYFPKCELPVLPIEEFIDLQDRNIWLRGEGMDPAMSGYEIFYQLDDINNDFLKWYAYSCLEFDLDLFMPYVDKKMADSLVKNKADIFSRVVLSDISGSADPEYFSDIADEYFDCSYFNGLYETHKQVIDSLYNATEEQALQKFSSYWYFSVKMPGKIVSTDAKQCDGKTALWYVYPIRMIDGPMKIEAVSVKTNIWACAVSAIVIGLAVYSILRKSGPRCSRS